MAVSVLLRVIYFVVFSLFTSGCSLLEGPTRRELLFRPGGAVDGSGQEGQGPYRAGAEPGRMGDGGDKWAGSKRSNGSTSSG